MRSDVARIRAGIQHAHGLARFRRGAGDALAQRNVVQVHALVVADAEAMPQNTCSAASTRKMLNAS